MRKGVTLIELLIVITILAVLAGAAIPYVQDYIDQSRTARARTDLDEISSALVRYELTRATAYTQTNVASLVGPFLSKVLVDPWGAAYVVTPASSSVWTKGPDGVEGGGDDLFSEFRPPLAVSEAKWIDVDNSGTVTQFDALHVKTTRPIQTVGAAATGLTVSGANTALSVGALIGVAGTTRLASYTFTNAAVSFTPGADTLTINGTTNLMLDGTSKRLRGDVLKVAAQ